MPRARATSIYNPLPADYPPNGPLEVSCQPTRWHLDSSDHGRHVWHYVPAEKDKHKFPPNPLTGQHPGNTEQQQSFESKHWLGLPTGASRLPSPNGDPRQAAQNAFEYYKRMQAPDGHWSGEYGGPMFLLPGIVISAYATKTELPVEWKVEMTRYIANMQRDKGRDDQGWGLSVIFFSLLQHALSHKLIFIEVYSHVEGRSTVFGTATNYAAMRLLGVDAEEPLMQRARATLHALGGAAAAPSWGKLWLSLLNCYSWDGMNVTPPELLLLPEWCPLHPSKYWIHMRSVYFPFAFLYGKRFQCPVDDLITAIRQEIYTQPYDSIHWPSQRNNVAKVDLYTPHPFVLDALFSTLSVYEGYVLPCFPLLRNKGLEKAYDLVIADDENTSYQALAPVNKPLNMICRYVMGDTEAVEKHKEKIRDFLWVSKQGMLACGTNGSQLWDIAFITQALCETGLANDPTNQESLVRALEWLDDCQIKENPPFMKEAWRYPTKGAWPFSTREQGYTVSDCTSEGLKSVLMLQKLPFTPKLVSEERIRWSIDLLLGMQCGNGGFASYEETRGYDFLELFNPAEVFGNIMVEHTYPECTTAVLTCLSMFQKQYPNYRSAEITRAKERAVGYILSAQRKDGSWFGSWGICFTYAGMFALESLASVGKDYSNSAEVRRGIDFFVERRMEDGGWGESFRSCESGVYVHSARSQVINTSWVVIALCRAKYPDRQLIRRAVDLIMKRQLPDGHWEREAIEGIFNKSCAITYPNFLFSWTIWALGAAAEYLAEEETQ